MAREHSKRNQATHRLVVSQPFGSTIDAKLLTEQLHEADLTDATVKQVGTFLSMSCLNDERGVKSELAISGLQYIGQNRYVYRPGQRSISQGTRAREAGRSKVNPKDDPLPFPPKVKEKLKEKPKEKEEKPEPAHPLRESEIGDCFEIVGTLADGTLVCRRDDGIFRLMKERR